MSRNTSFWPAFPGRIRKHIELGRFQTWLKVSTRYGFIV